MSGTYAIETRLLGNRKSDTRQFRDSRKKGRKLALAFSYNEAK